jgi:kynurenine formamidase
MKNKYRILSYPLNRRTPVYGRTRPLRVTADKSLVKGDPCNTYFLELSNHCGTHVDAPRHFIGKGKKISEYGINELIFAKPFIAECPRPTGGLIDPEDIGNIPVDCDILLIRTGYSKNRSKKIYRTNNPGLSLEAARWLRGHHPRLRAVGIDSISFSSFRNRAVGREVHRVLLADRGFKGRPLLLVEDIDLAGDLKGIKRILVVPLIIEEVDSAPCTIIAEYTNKESIQ